MDTHIPLEYIGHENNKRKEAAFVRTNKTMLTRMYGHLTMDSLPFRLINERRNKFQYLNNSDWNEDEEGDYILDKIHNELNSSYKDVINTNENKIINRESNDISLVNKSMLAKQLIKFNENKHNQKKLLPPIKFFLKDGSLRKDKTLLLKDKNKFEKNKILKNGITKEYSYSGTKIKDKLKEYDELEDDIDDVDYESEHEFYVDLDKEEVSDSDDDEKYLLKGINIKPVLKKFGDEFIRQFNECSHFYEKIVTCKYEAIDVMAKTAVKTYRKNILSGNLGKNEKNKYESLTEDESKKLFQKQRDYYYGLIDKYN